MLPKKHTLTVRTGPEEGTVFDLENETIIVGRDVTNDVILTDAEVSRRHSRLTLSPQGYVLEDLGSTNGTFVNGERLSGPYLLIPGDQIGFSQKLVVSFEMAPEAAAETVAVPPLIDEPPQKVEEPVAADAEESVAGDVASKPEEFEAIKEAAPEKKKRVNRWVVAGIGCAALVVVCGAIFWYMDAYHDKILYAPIYSLMRLLGFQ